MLLKHRVTTNDYEENIMRPDTSQSGATHVIPRIHLALTPISLMSCVP